MANNKAWVVWLVMIFLFISFVNGNSFVEKVGNDVQMKIINPPDLKIIKQTGDEQLLDFTWNKIIDQEYQIQICHKDFSKNKNKFKDDYKIKTIKQKKNPVKPKKNKTIDLKNNECQTVDLDFELGEIIKFGENSTEIIFSDDNITLRITPETSECEGFKCNSEIILKNFAESDVILNSNDLTVSVENDLSSNLIFWNGSELVNSNLGQQIVIQPDEELVFYLNSEILTEGTWKYNVTINYTGVHTIDPYYIVTNSTPPRAEFNTQSGQVILPSTIFNISGDALDYYNLTSINYEITKPDSTKTNFSIPIQTGFDTKRDNPFYTELDNFATYFGDFNTIYVQLGRFLVLTNITSNLSFNRLALEINSMVGNPDLESFMMNIIICETNTTFLATSTERDSDCTSPVIIVDTINISEQLGSSQFGTYEMLKMDNSLNISAGTSHIIAFEYASGFVNDGANDFWSVRGDAFSGVNNYGRVLNQNSTFFTSFIPSVKMFNDYNLTYTDTSEEGNYTIRLFAEDFHGNINDSETINFRVCEHNWTAQTTGCLINDTGIKTYIDSNDCPIGDPVPIDNGTVTSCNYCSEDIEQVYSSCYLLTGDYLKDVSYQDNNYFSCCAVTSIGSDCSILSSPYNTTTTENCSIVLEDDFDINLDLELYFGFGFGGLASDKVHGKIWINDTNTTYYCLSYVKTFDGNLVQTNPPYTKRTAGIIQIMGKEIEDREFFITQNGLANIYWTDNALVMDGRQYIFGVECAGDGENLKSEVLATVNYESVNAPITRFFWFKENVMAIILFLIILFVIVMVAGLYYKQVKS